MSATGKQATNAALAAGFEVTFRAFNDHSEIYYQEFSHKDGRGLVINTRRSGAFVDALGTNRQAWATERLSVGTLPELHRLLGGAR